MYLRIGTLMAVIVRNMNAFRQYHWGLKSNAYPEIKHPLATIWKFFTLSNPGFDVCGMCLSFSFRTTPPVASGHDIFLRCQRSMCHLSPKLIQITERRSILSSQPRCHPWIKVTTHCDYQAKSSSFQSFLRIKLHV